MNIKKCRNSQNPLTGKRDDAKKEPSLQKKEIPESPLSAATGEVIVIYEALCFDVALGRMNGAPNETRTHSCRFASQAC